MPAAAVVGAVVAATVAVTAVETTVAVFATIAAIGAAASAVGQIAGVKELTIAGTVLGAVGMVGGLAASAGVFGEAANMFGSVTNTAGGGAETVTAAAAGAAETAPAVTDAATWGAATTAATDATSAEAAATAAAASATPSNGVGIVDGISGAVTPPAAEATTTVAPVAPEASAATTAPVADVSAAPVADVAPTVGPDKTGLINQDALNPEGLVPDATKGINPADNFNSVGVDPATQNPLMQTSDVAQTAYPQGSMDGPDPTQTGFNNDDWASMNGPDPAAATGGSIKQGASAQIDPMKTLDPSGQQSVAGSGGMNIPNGDSPASIMAAQKVGSVDVSSPWGGVFDFLKKNDKYVLGALQAGGSFLNGAMSPLTPASVEALNAQAERNRAAANLENMQAQQLQRRMNNASGRIYGTYTPYSTGGLINGPAVTGRPA